MPEYNDAEGNPMQLGKYYNVNGTPNFKYIGLSKNKLNYRFIEKINNMYSIYTHINININNPNIFLMPEKEEYSTDEEWFSDPGDVALGIKSKFRKSRKSKKSKKSKKSRKFKKSKKSKKSRK
jgi:hypothetical protein